jgi:hypothetical protein
VVKKAQKKVAGKSNKEETMPAYKPSIYLDGKQIPKELKNAKPGAKVEFMATGKVLRTSEDLGAGKSISIELDKMSAHPKKKGGK